MRIPYELIASKTINAVNAADGVYVNWSKVPDAEKYEVYRKTSSDDDYMMIGTATKKNYTDYKEETQALVVQKEELVASLNQKEEEILRLKVAVEDAKAQAKAGMDQVVSEIEAKCKELENSFFDLQMENLQLKKEMEKYKSGEQF